MKKIFNTPLCDEFKKLNVDINVLLSPRGCRKSTDLQLFIVEKYLQNDELFLICRRKIDEPITQQWFSSYAQEQIHNKGYYITSQTIDRYLVRFDIVNRETEEISIIGYGAYLSVSGKYKSNYFTDCEKITNVILEECIDENEGVYISHSKKHIIQNLLSIASTICRNNKPIFWLLGNDIPNGYNCNLCYDLNIIDDLTPNVIHLSEYINYDKIKYKVAYKYFGDNEQLCWIDELNNYKKSIQTYNTISQTMYKIIYKQTEYFLYMTDNYLTISTKIDNANYYSIEELCKLITNDLPFTTDSLLYLSFYFPKEFKKYFKTISTSHGYEFEPKKISKKIVINDFCIFNLDDYKNKSLLDNIKSENSLRMNKIKEFIQEQRYFICTDLSLLINLKKYEVI